MDMEPVELLWMGGMISYLSISYGRRIRRGVEKSQPLSDGTLPLPKFCEAGDP